MFLSVCLSVCLSIYLSSLSFSFSYAIQIGLFALDTDRPTRTFIRHTWANSHSLPAVLPVRNWWHHTGRVRGVWWRHPNTPRRCRPSVCEPEIDLLTPDEDGMMCMTRATTVIMQIYTGLHPLKLYVHCSWTPFDYLWSDFHGFFFILSPKKRCFFPIPVPPLSGGKYVGGFLHRCWGVLV